MKRYKNTSIAKAIDNNLIDDMNFDTIDLMSQIETE